VGLHLGSWDVGASFLAQRRYPLSAIVRPSHGSGKLNRFTHNLRCKAGIGVISAQDGIRRAAEALRRNEVLALLIDAPTRGRLVKVRFLEGHAQFSAGAAVLALRTKAPVLPGCVVRLPDNTFKGFIGEQIEFGFSGDFRSNIDGLTQSILDSLEGFIKQYPDQWAMRHKIWCE
jgi:KDO2-lipid IV(A) lauroyltransferase